MVLWSISHSSVYLIELTVPWELMVQEAFVATSTVKLMKVLGISGPALAPGSKRLSQSGGAEQPVAMAEEERSNMVSQIA